MKNNKFAKISLVILTIALCLGVAFATSALAAEADETQTTSKPEIISQNIVIGDQFYLAYAVDAATVAEGSVTLYVYEKDPRTTDGEVPVKASLTVESSVSTAGTNLASKAENVYIFQIKNAPIAMADLTKVFYIKAVDSQKNESDIMRYSVAEYLYQRLATTPVTDEESGRTNPSQAQKDLYNNIIAFGNSAQLVKNEDEHYNTKGTEKEVALYTADSSALISNWRYVTVIGGKLDNYFTAGVYPIGTPLPLKADDGSLAAKWTVTPYNDGVAGTPLLNQTSVTVTDAERLAVEFGESVVITYPDGYRDLENITAGGNWGAAANNSVGFGSGNSAGKEFATVDGHGTVISATAINNSKYVSVTNEATGENYVEGTSKAFEMSFDIKLNTSGDAVDSIQVVTCVGGARKIYINFFQRDDSGNLRDTLLVKGFHSPFTEKEFAVNPSDWFNVRMVIYNDEPNYIYVYINGDKTDPLKYTRAGTSIDFAGLDEVRFYGNNISDGSDDGCYIDNIFVGFTTEENPWTAEQ